MTSGGRCSRDFGPSFDDQQNGLWLSLVERLDGVQEVQGSNPCSPRLQGSLLLRRHFLPTDLTFESRSNSCLQLRPRADGVYESCKASSWSPARPGGPLTAVKGSPTRYLKQRFAKHPEFGCDGPGSPVNKAKRNAMPVATSLCRPTAAGLRQRERHCPPPRELHRRIQSRF